MVSELQTNNINYLRILSVLRTLYGAKLITEKEYLCAKSYYLKLTGADITLVN